MSISVATGVDGLLFHYFYLYDLYKISNFPYSCYDRESYYTNEFYTAQHTVNSIHVAAM